MADKEGYKQSEVPQLEEEMCQGERPMMRELFTQAALVVKNPPANEEDAGRSLGWEDPLEKGMGTHSSTLAWRIPWREESGGLQSWGCTRVGHN